MSSTSKKERYLLAVRGQEVDCPPAWIMRQAGRYDPQYLALRERFTFRELCTNPDACAAASVLPLRTLDVDVLIVFNDILIPLEAMGLQVDFPDSGPVISNPLRSEHDLERFRAARFDVPAVAACIRRVKEAAGDQVPVIGFAGAPFTLVSYAVEGKMSRNQQTIKKLLFSEPALLHEMLERTTATAANYLVAQIEQGGADGVQIFESQACTIGPAEYEEFAAAYQRKLIARVKAACPEIPVTLYAKGSAAVLPLMAQSGADVVSIDWTHSLADARQQIGDAVALQGNLDPGVLMVPDAVEKAVTAMVDGFDWRRGFVANLGHGIIPQARVDAARRFVAAIHALGEQP
ncbi:MAG: uroporphyrinogen decarboxylase [Candidatus Sumerlaeaceae bacterium]